MPCGRQKGLRLYGRSHAASDPRLASAAHLADDGANERWLEALEERTDAVCLADLRMLLLRRHDGLTAGCGRWRHRPRALDSPRAVAAALAIARAPPGYRSSAP